MATRNLCYIKDTVLLAYSTPSSDKLNLVEYSNSDNVGDSDDRQRHHTTYIPRGDKGFHLEFEEAINVKLSMKSNA